MGWQLGGRSVFGVCVCVCRSVVSDSVTPMDCSPPGSSVHRILQVRILEWVAILSPGDIPDLGIKPRPPVLQAYSLPSEPPGKPVFGILSWNLE